MTREQAEIIAGRKVTDLEFDFLCCRGRMPGANAHYCPDWDFMEIDSETPEIEGCTCGLEEVMSNEPDWGWYAGADGETFTVGPEATRDGIIESAMYEDCGIHDQNEDGSWNYSFEIVEAYKSPIQLADHFDAGRWIEDLENGPLFDLLNPDGDGLGAEMTDDQFKSLETAIREAITKWQKDTGFHHEPWAFTGIRNRESISGKTKPEEAS